MNGSGSLVFGTVGIIWNLIWNLVLLYLKHHGNNSIQNEPVPKFLRPPGALR